MVVARERISARALGWEGERCWTRTNPIPVSGGSAPSSSVKASSPPAEAPTPTMGNRPASPGAPRRGGRGGVRSVGRARSRLEGGSGGEFYEARRQGGKEARRQGGKEARWPPTVLKKHPQYHADCDQGHR